MPRPSLLLLVPLGLPLGCAGDPAELGQADVSPACQPGDVTCATQGLGAPLALHGALALDVDLSVGSGTPTLRLEAMDPEVLIVEGTTVRAAGVGVSALLLRAEGEVIDFTHLFVSAPDRVGLERVDDGPVDQPLAGPIQLLPGDALTLAPHAYQGDARLLGHADTAWSLDGDAIALLTDGVPGRRRVVARAPGVATVAVEAFGFAAELEIEVLR